MFHTGRTWRIAPAASAVDLAHKLTRDPWTANSGFELEGYLFLNDSTGHEGVQEYAVVKKPSEKGTSFVHVKSMTIGRRHFEKALDLIQKSINGEYDKSEWARLQGELAERPKLEPAFPSLGAFINHLKDFPDLRGGKVIPIPRMETWEEMINRISVPGRITRVSRETYDYFVGVLPPRWMGGGHHFCFAEGIEPYRLFWKDKDDRYFARQLGWDETRTFARLVRAERLSQEKANSPSETQQKDNEDALNGEVPRSFAVEVQENGSTRWVGNALRFPEKEQAAEYGRDVYSRWSGIQSYRVIESSEPANYTFVDRQPQALGRNEDSQQTQTQEAINNGGNMGWYFTNGATKADIIAEVTKEKPRQPAFMWSNAEQKSLPCGYDFSSKTLHRCVRGSVLWTVEETVRYKEQVERDTFIGCYLLEAREGKAGYKPMDESMGPYYYSCPLSYLDMVPEANKEWREKVRTYYAEKAEQKCIQEQTPSEARREGPTPGVSTLDRHVHDKPSPETFGVLTDYQGREKDGQQQTDWPETTKDPIGEVLSSKLWASCSATDRIRLATFLADIRHLSGRDGVDFERALHTAMMNHPTATSAAGTPQTEICSLDLGRFSAVVHFVQNAGAERSPYPSEIRCDGRTIFNVTLPHELAGVEVILGNGGLEYLTQETREAGLPDPTERDYQDCLATVRTTWALITRFVECGGHEAVLQAPKLTEELGLEVSGRTEPGQEKQALTIDRGR
jgi:hypothetical protein